MRNYKLRDFGEFRINAGDCVITSYGVETAIRSFWGYDINMVPWWTTLDGCFITWRDIVAVIASV
jgi:hypothetical protein